MLGQVTFGIMNILRIVAVCFVLTFQHIAELNIPKNLSNYGSLFAFHCALIATLAFFVPHGKSIFILVKFTRGG
jgi:hypothetical protein